MPKILIREQDNTKPGTPGGYANYSVLIPGFMGREPISTAMAEEALKNDPNSKLKADAIQPDSNGIYEFDSQADFLATIKLVEPEFTVGSDLKSYHYGNQMAFELLGQGYTVLYIPIEKENCVEALQDANTWELFKDKANYDFRFITHGLLESTDTSAVEAEKDELINALRALHNKEAIIFDEEKLLVTLGKADQVTDSRLEVAAKAEENYKALIVELEEKKLEVPGLIDASTGKYYLSCADAVEKILAQLDEDAKALDACITTTVINSVNSNIAKLAMCSIDEDDNVDEAGEQGRGDCIALIELDEKLYTTGMAKPEVLIINAMNELPAGVTANGKFCALTVPSVVYTNTDSQFVNHKLPGAFHYLACFMNALRLGFAEWYAAAGYTRGVSAYNVKHTTVKLGEIAINALEPRNLEDSESAIQPKFACNVIANFRGSYYLWGNRTAHQLGSKAGGNDLVASHFLNIRQLCTTIKKQLYVACRRFTFDPNSDTLWFNFVNAIKPTLEAMKADQGIRDYKIMKVVEANPKKATLKAKIRIIPIEAVEDFDLTVSLEDSFGETAVNTGDLQ